MTEINEDNCVLSKFELEIIDKMLESNREQVGNPGFGLKEMSDSFLSNLFQKIKKLNDMAKEKQK